MKKSNKKTSLGAWLFVAAIIIISIASAAYNQYQRENVQREVQQSERGTEYDQSWRN